MCFVKHVFSLSNQPYKNNTGYVGTKTGPLSEDRGPVREKSKTSVICSSFGAVTQRYLNIFGGVSVIGAVFHGDRDRLALFIFGEIIRQLITSCD